MIINTGGSTFNNILEIESPKTIYKVSNNTFSFGKLDYDNNFIKNLCHILDKGGKFIPNLINNRFVYFNNLFNEIDNSLVRFNKNILIEKSRIEKENNNRKITNENESYLNELDNNNIIDNELEEINEIDEINDKIKKNSKCTQNYSRISLRSETIKLRKLIFDDVAKNNHNIKDFSNLNKEEMNTLIEFTKIKPFRKF